MLTFLRKIRRSLIGSGATQKYLLYAIGEILLVMIGILLALQVNNWNQDRNDRKTEEQVLVNLEKNLILNVDKLNQKLARIERDSRLGAVVFSVIKDKKTAHDTLTNHWHRALLNHGNVEISEAGYESLKNVGFEIINNEILKEQIVNLFEDTYLSLNRAKVWGNTDRPDWDRYVLEHFIRGGKELALIPRDADFLLNDNYFYGLIDLAEAQRGFYGNHYKDCLEETEKVLQLIQDELKSRE